MTAKLLLLFSLFGFYGASEQAPEELQMISKSHSAHLEKYTTYSDSVIMHFTIPQNTIFASILFVGSEQDLSIFGCSTRNVSLYLKYGAPPVINPDGSRFPEEFKNTSRAAMYNLEFKTDKKEVYVNISSPEPGTYYAATFLAYEDPRYAKISQQGLTQSCEAYVDSALYISKIDTPIIVTEFQIVEVIAQNNNTRHFMFMVPEVLDHVILNVNDVMLSSELKNVVLRVEARKPPSKDTYLLQTVFNTSTRVIFRIEPHTWYYLAFYFPSNANTKNDSTEFSFNLRFFLNRLPQSSRNFIWQTFGNVTLYNMSVQHKNYHNYKLTEIQPYMQFDLTRESSQESFTFSYKLQPEIDNNMFLPINVTSKEFVALRFVVQKGSDIGGTLQYILAFKPRVSRTSKLFIVEKEPPNHTLVGCLQRNSVAVPIWPHNCYSNEITMLGPLVLNQTVTNSTVLIPYPESGVWYASFKLFCGICQPCNCPTSCQEEYEKCVITCELNCSSPFNDNCKNCPQDCGKTVLNSGQCSGCDCDGPCLRNSSTTCNSSVIFDVSSRSCYYGDCGKQGQCGLFISEGVAYSSCLCRNNYRGFDCSDGSLATPYYLVLIEFLLLILSNIFFLPATYIAYKREYYVESLSYFSIFLSSSFYHACDAGESILSFCIFRLGALQFADFFSALLAIWLTLLAMADLPSVHLSLLQMAGSIVIAFCVTLNRYALWIFALPSGIGLVIIGISWYLKYRKYRCRFLERTYLYVKLPVGGATVFIGLTIYGLLQTQDNYKYLHTLWHMIMATGVVFLLPKKDTFQAAVL